MAALPPLYLLDTNVLVHLVRGDRVWARIRGRYQPLLADPTPIVSVVTAGELRSLALQFRWGADKIGQMEYCLGYFRRVSIDDPDVIRRTRSSTRRPSRPAARSGRTTSGSRPRPRSRGHASSPRTRTSTGSTVSS